MTPTNMLRRAMRLGAAFALAATAALDGHAQNLSALPDYAPQQRVSGTIRSSGNDQMAGLMKRWERAFMKYHADVRFADTLKGTAAGIYGLEMRTADIALMGRAMNPFERYGTYERSWTYPVEIEVATGSAHTPHKSAAFAIFVHRDNPLSKLTLKQLDGIFGAERGGGWKALSWDEGAARSAAENIRTWGGLGLKGDWADKPIHVYGPPSQGAGAVTFFQARVLKGGAMWSEELREYADRGRMMADLARDPYGIAYAALSYGNDQVKPLAVAETEKGPYVSLDKASVTDRTYPLARPVYIVYTIDNERSEIADPRIDPKIREFLRFILSRQGQRAVAEEGSYLPLPPKVVQAQLRKLDSKDTPPEKLLLGE